MSATSTRAMISLNAVILPVKIIAPSLFVRHDKTSWERLNVTFLNKKFSSWMITGKIHGNTLFVWYFSLWYCNAMILTDTDFRQNHCAMILKSIFVKTIASFKYNVKYCFHGSIRLLFSQKELKTEFRSQETRSRLFHGFRNDLWNHRMQWFWRAKSLRARMFKQVFGTVISSQIEQNTIRGVTWKHSGIKIRFANCSRRLYGR